jgi:hypothetical protein
MAPIQIILKKRVTTAIKQARTAIVATKSSRSSKIAYTYADAKLFATKYVCYRSSDC